MRADRFQMPLDNKGKGKQTETVSATPAAMRVHVCYRAADVIMDEALCMILVQDLDPTVDSEDPDAPTEFDLWFHGQLLAASCGIYNAA